MFFPLSRWFETLLLLLLMVRLVVPSLPFHCSKSTLHSRKRSSTSSAGRQHAVISLKRCQTETKRNWKVSSFPSILHVFACVIVSYPLFSVLVCCSSLDNWIKGWLKWLVECFSSRVPAASPDQRVCSLLLIIYLVSTLCIHNNECSLLLICTSLSRKLIIVAEQKICMLGFWTTLFGGRKNLLCDLEEAGG
jgi:hypothetical protein